MELIDKKNRLFVAYAFGVASHFFLDYRSKMTAKIAESVSTHDFRFVLLFLLLRVCFCFAFVY